MGDASARQVGAQEGLEESVESLVNVPLEHRVFYKVCEYVTCYEGCW